MCNKNVDAIFNLNVPTRAKLMYNVNPGKHCPSVMSKRQSGHRYSKESTTGYQGPTSQSSPFYKCPSVTVREFHQEV
jgi:hypothetical protein